MRPTPLVRRAALTLLWVFTSLSRLSADTPPATNRPPIVLPSFIVSDTRAQWRYVATPDFEILSNFPDATTTDLATQLSASLAVFRTLVPPAFQLRPEVPLMLILDQREPTAVLPGATRQTWEKSGKPRTVFTGGGDMTYHDEDIAFLYLNFHILLKEPRAMHRMGDGVAEAMLLALLERSAPQPPSWLPLALHDALNARIDRRDVQLTGIPSSLPKQTAERPVAPLAEAFADWMDTAANRPPPPADNALARLYTAALFVRWGLFADNGAHQAAFFNFVTRSSLEAAPTESLFAECFGFDCAIGLEKLKSFRPQAAKSVTIKLRKLAASPAAPSSVRDATDAEEARITGEWARLAARKNPQIDGALLGAAQRRLDRGVEKAPNDPRLLAARAILALNQGDAVRAQPLLETAIRGGVLRPRAYFEISRFRLTAAQAAPAGAAGKLSAAQIGDVLDPLGRAYPPSRWSLKSYQLAATAWRHSESEPQRMDLAPLLEGVHRFPRETDLAFKSAELHARHGYTEEVATLIRMGVDFAADKQTRERFLALRKILPPP